MKKAIAATLIILFLSTVVFSQDENKKKIKLPKLIGSERSKTSLNATVLYLQPEKSRLETMKPYIADAVRLLDENGWHSAVLVDKFIVRNPNVNQINCTA